jgi:hypothetical protein
LDDLLFDDATWTLRYFVARIGGLLSRRRVLVLPERGGELAAAEHGLSIALSGEELGACPSIDTDRPVSLQSMASIHEYYGWPLWWAGELPLKEQHSDPHLRSVHDVSGYAVHTEDAVIGQLRDFLLDGQWRIRALRMRPRRALVRRGLLADRPIDLPPGWVRAISWVGESVELRAAAELLARSGEERLPGFRTESRPES